MAKDVGGWDVANVGIDVRPDFEMAWVRRLKLEQAFNEQFEIGFMRDKHPASEVDLWCRIAKGWMAYPEKFLHKETLPDEDEKKLLGALIAISTGVEDVTKLNVSVEVGRRLTACYEEPAKVGAKED